MAAGEDLHAERLDRVEIPELCAGTSLGDHHGGTLVRERAGGRDPGDPGADHDHAIVGERSAHDVPPRRGVRVVLIPSLPVR